MLVDSQFGSITCLSCALLLTAPDSFSYKKFFQLIGLTKKSPEEVREVFRLLDDNNSGFIEESELKYVLSILFYYYYFNAFCLMKIEECPNDHSSLIDFQVSSAFLY